MKTIQNKHIGSYGIIIKNEKIVLIKKARGGYKGKLDLPGGGIEHSELPQEALKREIWEETGLIVSTFQLFDVTSTNFTWEIKNNVLENLHHIGILFLVEAYGKLKKEPDGIDSNGANWYEINKLKKEELTPFVAFSLEKMGFKIL